MWLVCFVVHKQGLKANTTDIIRAVVDGPNCGPSVSCPIIWAGGLCQDSFYTMEFQPLKGIYNVLSQSFTSHAFTIIEDAGVIALARVQVASDIGNRDTWVVYCDLIGPCLSF